jgi:hypothetical protein
MEADDQRPVGAAGWHGMIRLTLAILVAAWIGALAAVATFEARACAAQWEELTR